ncbi:Dynein heavy chain 7, axonemal [Hondaea fermentalgiana]|uniref:Dynein heavy chain 7, axonemal n=1 Tax=Hondaea fermentalgiana TaxID=2315210 RepID=A0A2R5GEQ6_9STRA|nr:Dynein heavy chain 7, axonemal [Hondaea fermentalgiana]|eukprot:GBG29412.1 Dynein heavy chain 7, axonemal [Hondaea fermentalgiana]
MDSRSPRSPRRLNPLQSVGDGLESPTKRDETIYSSPSDKIGRNYTPQASKLTVRTLNKDTTGSVRSPTKPRLRSPISIDSPHADLPTSPKSPPGGIAVAPTPGQSPKRIGKRFNVANWSPAPATAPTPSIQTVDSIASDLDLDTTTEGEVFASSELEHEHEHEHKHEHKSETVATIDGQGSRIREKVKHNTKRFRTAVDEYQCFDVCGRQCEIARHKESWEHRVLDKLPVAPPNSLLSVENRQGFVSKMISDMRGNYFACVKSAAIEYELLEPSQRASLGIDPRWLRDPQQDWTSQEFTQHAWRVLRRTGVSRPAVEAARAHLYSHLALHAALRDLQTLWIEDMAPCSNFVEMGMLEYRLHLPFEPMIFAKHSEGIADAVRLHLKDKWLQRASEILSESLEGLMRSESPKKAKAGCADAGSHALSVEDELSSGPASPSEQMASAKANSANSASCDGGPRIPAAGQLILDTACVLMSRQVRSAIDASLDDFEAFFRSYTDDVIAHKGAPPVPLFVVQLTVAEEDSTPEFSPSAEDLIHTVNQVLESIVNAAGKLPRVDGEAFLAPCEMLVNNERLQALKEIVSETIVARYEDCKALTKSFASFSGLFDGSEDAAVQYKIKNRKFGMESRASLKELNAELMRFRTVQDEIDAAVQDTENFSMFRVDCAPIKTAFRNKAEKYVETVQLQVAKDNSQIMQELCTEYSEMMQRLIKEPQDSEELHALILYAKECETRAKEMEKRIVTEVSPRINFAINYDYHLTEEDTTLVQNVYAFPAKVWESQRRSEKLQESQKQMRIQVLERRREFFADELSRAEEDCLKLQTMGDLSPVGVERALKRVNDLRKVIGDAENEMEGIREQEELLAQEVTTPMWMTRISGLKKSLDPYGILWDTAKLFAEQTSTWLARPLVSLDAEEIDRDADNVRRATAKLVKEFERQEVEEPLKAATVLLNESKTYLDEYIPLMLLLCNPGLRERHWGLIADITKLPVKYSPEVNLESCIEVGLHKFTNEIEDTCVSANKEYSLEKGMDKMEREWEPLEFVAKPYRNTGTYIVGGFDEIQTLLDDHIVKAQAMRSSRYVQPFIERIKEWEQTLIDLQNILDNWLKLQGTWLYLEPIFGSPDIMKQMPTEAKMFREVDDLWREAVGKTAELPSVIITARRPGLLSDMLRANELMDEIQKGLNNYLETKRLYFPRFFFLSNDELLEILSETKDPLRVQPHLKKCFEGINELFFDENLDIRAMLSPQKERVDFTYDKIDHDVINPNSTGGNVEVWLVQTETVMRRSVAYTLDLCMKAYAEAAQRIQWVQEWQGQMLIGTSQAFWTLEVEKALRDKGNAGLFEYFKVLQTQLQDIVQLVRGDLPKLMRTAIGAMVTLDVHSRDTVGQLAEGGVATPLDFDWIAQLRYYWYDNSHSATTGTPGSLDVKMITACCEYDYEYLGCSGRLVVTPLTDRCYRTLMGALQLLYGGAPEGPAGTGKTETTKDLGKAVAVQTVVFNCSDGLDYLAMGKFFKGLLSSGAWACFDEFNRIELEVLSVVAQQILTIQRGKIDKAEVIEFEGTTLPLKVGCNVYITMNPGYAGRSELPDNLKALFRPCAMMVPDYALIGEIILYSFGYLNAKVLAKKIVATYRLCSEQLSSQKHYDYGMRAVMSVLRAAGAQKRLKENRETDEAVLMLRSIIDVNEPKFLSQDMPLFQGIVGDLFPGVVLPEIDRSLFRNAFLRTCTKLGLQPDDYFYGKVIQVYEMMLVRHGFMVVGLPFGGKTSSWRCLQDLLTLLHEENPDDSRWQKVVDVVINPKSISMGMLYGQFDPVTHEWTDGVLAIKYRDCANNKIGEEPDRKWVMFDGPVDAIWIENMNTVLDDNKKLCLQSGEMVALSDTMSMMFEPMDLEVASPATVSRCGVIFFEPHRLDWFPLLQSWLDRITTRRDISEVVAELEEDEEAFANAPPFFITRRQRRLLTVLFKWLMDPCIIFVRKKCREEAPTVNANLVVSCIRLLESCLETLLRNPTAPHGTPKIREATDVEVETYFLFALVWSLGASIDAASRPLFSEYLRQVLNDQEGKFIEESYPKIWIGLLAKGWKLPSFNLEPIVREVPPEPEDDNDEDDEDADGAGKEDAEGGDGAAAANDSSAQAGEQKAGEAEEEEEYEEEAGNGPKTHKFQIPVPEGGLVYDYCYLPEEERWKSWIDLLDKFKIANDAEYSAIVVPTENTCQFSYLLTSLYTHEKPTLVIGPTGTGKSTYVVDCLMNRLDRDTYMTIMTAFSANTSAAQLQDIVDGRMDRRRKGVFGPALGKKYMLFVDDLNMPVVEEYGAQPPIELLRQFVDNGGWYDLKEKSFRNIIDTLLVAAMGPPGGGRNFITPRMMRHFNVLTFTEFSDQTLTRIFQTLATWHFGKPGFDESIRGLAGGIVTATLEAYTKAKEELLPTPAKSHYTFNLRDFSRVIQGVTMVGPQTEGVDRPYIVRLWVHEVLRVFSDRLIDDTDRTWFLNYLKTLSPKHFNADFSSIFKHLKESRPADNDFGDDIVLDDMRRLFFGDFMVPGADPRMYEEIQEIPKLSETLDTYLEEYNSVSKTPMQLVLFLFAIEHVSRISRVLSMPGGNALLVGVGGSGRQSLTRLAGFIADFDVIQIEISKNYNKVEWHEDLKRVIRAAALNPRDAVFLFSDSQIKQPSFVEDINNLLNSGEIPNLFPSDEKAECLEAVRPFAKQVYGKKAADMNALELWQFFVQRVRKKLHVVLAFSPIGGEFRDRLRMYPSLINCCVIDWFSLWPADALVAVAERFLADLPISDTEAASKEEILAQIVITCQSFHTSIQELSDHFRSAMRRINYVTPTSYLELILAYKGSLSACREKVLAAKRRYEIGLEKLDFAASSVADMQKQLTDLQPVLAQSQADTDALMKQIEEKLPGVEATKEAVGKDAAVAQGEADRVGAIKKECEDDLAVAMPLLQEAVDALDTLKPSDINEVKNFKTPPGGVVLTMEAICVMLNIKCAKAKDPNDPTKKVDDWWTPGKKLLADPKFLQTLKDYDKDNINPKFIKIIRDKFVNDPNFEPEIVKKASVAACGMCKWVRAMESYDKVAKVVAPKKAALAEAEAELSVTMGELQKKQDALKAVEDELAALQAQFQAACDKKKDLEDEVDLCGKKLERAKTLIDGLGGEKSRWTQSALDLAEQCTLLTGDVLVSAGVIAYLGPFTAGLRDKQVASWTSMLHERKIPTSEGVTLNATLGDPVATRQWHVNGLPTDAFSVDNGIVVFNSRRWPLLIDPQGQANKWIRNMEKERGLHVIKLSDGNYLRTVENAVQFGQPVLLENVGETLDAALEPLLLKQTFKQGGVECLRLGDSTVEYSPEFQFYITTKLPNPHYLPEVAVKVTLLNFMITPDGLEDQLLGTVVLEERPDLAEEKARLIVEGAENSRKLKELEDNILHILSSSSGNILEDESAINALNSSKVLSNEIAEKQAVAEQTEKTIDEVRQGYRPIAYHGQLLYFCIADLANIEPVYQYSLSWFSNLFVASIRNSEKSDDLEERLENLRMFFTYSLYCNICRSLLEKDKLLFAFLLTVKLMFGAKELEESEWYFLLTGGVAMDNPHENPASEWLADKSWGEVCRLSNMPAFEELRETFAEDATSWKKVYDASNAHREPYPDRWEGDRLTPFQRMLVLRCIRPDRVTLAVQDFVINKMGERFVKPPPFDLGACYSDSNALSPLIFILSPGSDPMASLLKFADSVKQQVSSISLGQGQGPIAERMIAKAQEDGTWVVLQNCHLAVSWMSAFERICELITTENTKPEFRMWCTSYPSADFPVSVLQNGVKMTNEPPKGLRANLIGSYSSDPIADPDFFESSVAPDKEANFHMMLFGLAIFHALVQERRLFGPMGWNIPYEFTDADLSISAAQLAFFIEQFDMVPFKALHYTAAECNYGGRVTDDKDRRCLHVILSRFYRAEVLDAGFAISPSGAYTMPDPATCTSRDDFVEHIEKFPLVAEPEVFGLHANATITKDRKETNDLFTSILLTQADTNSAGAKSPDEVMDEVAQDILSRLPETFNLELAQVRFPVRWDESLNTVLQQELVRYNRLTSVIRPSLVNLRKAVRGEMVMSAELERVGNSMFYGLVPGLWAGKSYPSLKPLGGYVTDLLRRLDMLGSWLENEPPAVFWISGFYFTQAFLTGCMQNYARKNQIAIDSVNFDFEVMPKTKYQRGPESTEGAYVDGLFFDGARWDRDTQQLADPHPKQLFSLAPVLWLKPMPQDEIKPPPHYNCPVYKTSERRGVLATTGHSSNFLMYMRIPSEEEQGFWIERGVALLTQLDD